MKKNILMIIDGGEKWIGGVYYCKNILYLMTHTEKLQTSINIYVYINEKLVGLFQEFTHMNNIFLITFENIVKEIEIIKLCDTYAIDLIYPINFKPLWVIEDICAYWIPDFQHVYLPHMFPPEEIGDRNKLYQYIAEHHEHLVVSSRDAYKTYKELYPDNIDGVYVIPFISYIEKEVKEINDKFISDIQRKYELEESYIYIANQFWKHKNHITAFKAVNELVNNRNYNITLVCTGNTEDYRNKEHYEMLSNYVRQCNLEKNIKILGMVSRKDQLAIMKGARLVIQPSLFEGWGTVVEDAKVMDKTILLSDIDVHYEQKNDKCILFRKENPIELADYIMRYYDNAERGDVTKGIIRMREDANKYSQGLVDLINSIKPNKVQNRLRALFKKRENVLKPILKNLFSDVEGKNIGIYGTGEHTDFLVEAYKNLIGDINFKLFFFDSNSSKWGMTYHKSTIMNPKEIEVLELDRIIISSYSYQEQIYNYLKKYEEIGISIIKIYEENDKILFRSK